MSERERERECVCVCVRFGVGVLSSSPRKRCFNAGRVPSFLASFRLSRSSAAQREVLNVSRIHSPKP